jgi:hypothetical protein
LRASKAPSVERVRRRTIAGDKPKFDPQLLDESSEEDDTGAENSVTSDVENNFR